MMNAAATMHGWHLDCYDCKQNIIGALLTSQYNHVNNPDDSNAVEKIPTCIAFIWIVNMVVRDVNRTPMIYCLMMIAITMLNDMS
jgi:hypothetical protein